MKKTFLTIAAAMMMLACTQTDRKNPFLEEWTTPEGVPPFEQIQVTDYLPAFEEGIKQQKAEIKAIVDNPEAPTFENTLAAMDASGKLLDKVSMVFFNITESDGSDELDKVMETVLPLVSEHNDNIYMDAKLFERVKAVYDAKDGKGYTAEQLMLLDRVYKTFVRNGIALPADKQARLREINSKLSVLQQQFGKNLLAETNAYKLVLEKEEDLAGLPESVRAAAAELAKANGMEGKWVIGLQNPSRIPFLQNSDRRDLREQVYKAYISRGNNGNENDNKKIVLNIVKLRIEKANLLGFETPADFILDDTMAKKSDVVNSFLLGIFNAGNKKAKKELAEMQAIADREGKGVKIEPWDWDYYAQKLRKEKYAMNEDEIKPYFKMENVRAGAFAVAHKLYGLNFEKLEGMPLFNPEAECFRVTDADSSLIGIFYTDYYPRASKRGGAWMTNFREQSIDKDGNDVRPVVINIANFTKPTATEPSLLTIDEVQTLFHEFGHGLHGLLAKANYKTVSGTNVARDFVELPSQIMENWAVEPEVLAMYAKHYKTGEVIPTELIEKIQATSTFNQGFMTTELAAAAILDMNWHDLKSADGIDPVAFEKTMMDKIGLIPEIAPRYRTTYFNHIWSGGYSAGYYSYLWAEVLDKDAFQAFKTTGLFNPTTARAFRTLLEKGGTEEPMVLYRTFRGAEPNPEAMLVGRGLK
ncbi:M3 family metallopeptidase [Xylanibacter muris]|uniref:M3 family metallopeptidase n=1 Tax=Xylanibacter muris TaxID=2736290 RepID=A0ABX2AJU8_9BACT|nr:M3 family metallopeptidase [Xylanibacter muris]